MHLGGIILKILAVGDLVGETGVEKLKRTLPNLQEAEHIDFTIINGENSAGGTEIKTMERRASARLFCSEIQILHGNIDDSSCQRYNNL